MKVTKKRYPILDENNQPSTFPNFGSQVFGDDDEGRALWQNGKGFYADLSKNSENCYNLGNAPANEYQKKKDAFHMELLWENASYGSAFGAQTLSIPGLSNFDAVGLTINWHIGAGILQESPIQICRPEIDRNVVFISSGSEQQARWFKISGDDIVFESAIHNGTASNVSAIPTRIYGIKGLK